MEYAVIRHGAMDSVVVFMKALDDGAVYFKNKSGTRQWIINIPTSNGRGGDIAFELRKQLRAKGLTAQADEINKAAQSLLSVIKHTDESSDDEIIIDEGVEIIDAPYPEHGKAQIPRRCFIYDDEDGYPEGYQGFIEHHGILGMKWGVRRYQNADGSLTDAGKKRYGLGDPKYQRKHGINETENVMKNLVFMRKGTEVAKDNYKFRKSSGNEKEFKTGEAQARATQNYANFLKDAYNMFDDMIPKGNGKLTGESREKYISYLLNQTVEHLNSPAMQGYVSEGTKIFYKIDTSRGLSDIDFKLEFEYPDQRKIK